MSFLRMSYLLPVTLLLSVSTASASNSLSYSGRLVNSNGSPVTGSVNLKFELAYTIPGGVGPVLCSQEISSVALSNGVFHVKLDPDCSPSTLSGVLAATPDNESVAIRVTDLSVGKVYSYQALYSIPFAQVAQVSKQLPQMGASTGQVLVWNGSAWAPANESGAGNGSVTSVTTGAGLQGGPITTTGEISIAPGGVVDSMLAGGINPAKLAGVRDASHYLKGDNTWSPFSTDVLNALLTGYSAAPASDLSSSDSVLGAFSKLQGQASALDSGKLDKTGGTLSIGTINGVPTPLAPDEIVNKAYVDDAINGVNASQWNTVALGIHYSAGRVGIGTSAPSENLDVIGNVAVTGKVRLQSNTLNYVELVAPDNVLSTLTFKLPANAGVGGQALVTDGSGNLSWGSAATDSGSIADGSIVNADISPTAEIEQSKIQGLTTALSGKENSLPAGGAATHYLNGLKQWVTLDTSKVPENGNLYFTTARTRASLSASTPLIYDNASGALSFLAAGSDGNLLRSNGTNWISWTPDFLTAEADTLQTVTDRGASTTTQVGLGGGATFPGNGIWNSSGNVGVGTTSPAAKVDIRGNLYIQDVTQGSGFKITNQSGNNYIESASANMTGSADLHFTNMNAVNTWAIIKADGKFGIGTTTPRSKLEVAGGIQIGADGAACDLTKPGTLRYSGGNVEYCNGSSWQAFGVSGAGITNINGATQSSQSFANGSSGTAPGWSTAGGVHTLNIPMASAAGVSAGLVSKSEFDALNAKLGTTTTFAGDVSGTYNSTSVDKIKGTSVSITSLTSGNFLKFNGTNWINSMLGASDIPNLDAAKITSGVLPVSRGGTNTSSLSGNRLMVSTTTAITEAAALTNGQLLIGSTGAAPVAATLTAGSGVSITNSPGGISISATGTGGTVTSVSGNAPISVATGTTTPVISISQANGTTNGYLSSTDWNTFNNKQNDLSSGATINGIVYPASGAQTLQIPLAPVNLTDAVNKQYVDTQVSSNSHWALGGGNVYRSTGYVGIGTSTPGQRLTVANVTPDTPVVDGGGNSIFLYGSGAAYFNGRDVANGVEYAMGTSTAVGEVFAGSMTAHNFTLRTANQKRLTVTAAGNIGIGTATPAEKLEVSGTIKLSGRILSVVDGANNTFWTAAGSSIEDNRIAYGFNADPVTGVVDHTIMRTNGQERLRVNNAGNVGIGTSAPSEKLHVNGKVLAVSYEYTSDERLKKNIATIPYALDKVSQLNGVTFDWRVDEYPERSMPKERTYGFIAQEVEKHVPELVSTGKDGFKSVQYGNITALLVEAVKELFTGAKEVEKNQKELQRKVASLEAQNQKLQAEMNAIKAKHAQELDEIKKSIQELKKK